MKKILSVVAILFSSLCFAQTSFKNYLLKDIGYISIPTNMELQNGNYKKLAQEYQKQQAKKIDYEVSDIRIVFQDKTTINETLPLLGTRLI